MRRLTRPAGRPPAGRGGFTLIELLVAAALSLVVMTVLALAFQTGTDTLSHLKSVVGMAEQLRAAEAQLRADLQGVHMTDDQERPVRVSEGSGSRGYFHLTQGGLVQTGPNAFANVAPFAEARGAGDAENLRSFRTPSASGLVIQTAGNTSPPPALGTPYNETAAGDPAPHLQYGRAWMDVLQFTVRQSGDNPQAVFRASTNNPGATPLPTRLKNLDRDALPAQGDGSEVVTRWAEVAYFLLPAGGTTPRVFTSDEGGVTALPLYTLYRRQRGLADRTITSPSPPLPAPQGPNDFGRPDAVFEPPTTTPPLPRIPSLAMDNLGAGGRWRVLGPEAVSSGAAVSNRLGGQGDPFGPLVPTTLPPAFQQELQRRPYPIALGAPEAGADVLVSNIVSMTVRPVFTYRIPRDVQAQAAAQNTSVRTDALALIPTTDYSPRDLLPFEPYSLPTTPPTVGAQPGNSGPYRYGSRQQFPRMFDTGGGQSVPVRFFFANGTQQIGFVGADDFTLHAVEVKLRVYDAKNKNARQMTVLEPL